MEEKNNILFSISKEDVDYFQKETGKSEEEIQLLYSESILFFDAITYFCSIKKGEKLKEDEVFFNILNYNFDNDPEIFKQGLDYTKQNHIFNKNLNVRSLDSLKDMKLLKVENENLGIALKKLNTTSEFAQLVSIYNGSKYKGMGMFLLQRAVELGGKYLECFAINGNDILKGLRIAISFEIYKSIKNEKTNITLYYLKHKDAPALM